VGLLKKMLRRENESSDEVDLLDNEIDDDNDDDDYGETLSVYDAADIWLSNGMDEDYTFGYTEEELREASR
jgi:hypothetical protein